MPARAVSADEAIAPVASIVASSGAADLSSERGGLCRAKPRIAQREAVIGVQVRVIDAPKPARTGLAAP
jgi:hypothetical protein